MNMNLNKRILALAMLSVLFAGCSKFLNKQPFASLTPSDAFQSASDLQLYVNSFYVNQIPSANTIFTGDNTSDYISGNSVPALMNGQTNANNAPAGWTWTEDGRAHV